MSRFDDEEFEADLVFYKRKPSYEELEAEVLDLKIENARLRQRSQEFTDFVDTTIRHQNAASRQMLEIFLTPGVTESYVSHHRKVGS